MLNNTFRHLTALAELSNLTRDELEGVTYHNYRFMGKFEFLDHHVLSSHVYFTGSSVFIVYLRSTPVPSIRGTKPHYSR